MVTFDDAADVQQTVDAMIERGLLIRIPKAPGQREDRYAHLLCGEPDVDAIPAAAAGRSVQGALETRVADLEQEVASLKAEIQRLRSLID